MMTLSMAIAITAVNDPELRSDRQAGETDQAFVLVAAAIWRRRGLSPEVKMIAEEGDLARVHPESVDDSGREFLLCLRRAQ